MKKQGKPNPEGGKVAAFVLDPEQSEAIKDFKEKGEKLARDSAAFLLLAAKVKAIFADKPRGAKIEGCSKFDEFVEKVFKKSARTVRSWLAAAGLTDKRFANKPEEFAAPAEDSVPQHPDGAEQATETPVHETSTLPCPPSVRTQSVSSVTGRLTTFYAGLTTELLALTKSLKKQGTDEQQRIEAQELVRALRHFSKDAAERADRFAEILKATAQ